MDFRDTPEDAAFRAELRAWIADNLPEGWSERAPSSGRMDESVSREWSKKLYDAGYSGLTWPKEYGGQGAPYTHQAIFLEENARAETPEHIGVIGLGMAGPTIIAHGTDEQKSRTPRTDPVRRGGLVPGVFRVRIGQRPGLVEIESRRCRRSLRRQRAEGLVELRPHRRLLHSRRSHRSGRAEAQRNHLSRSMAGEAAVAACERSIQVHGGIGFTWEHILHRYYKRALAISVFNGTPAAQRAAIAATLLDH